MSLLEPQIEIIPELSHSALVKTKYSADEVNVPWHCHPEIEIVYVCDGFGSVVVGDNIFAYRPGNLFIFGSDVPHMFRSETNKNISQNTHIVIQFSPKMLNNDFFNFFIKLFDFINKII